MTSRVADLVIHVSNAAAMLTDFYETKKHTVLRAFVIAQINKKPMPIQCQTIDSRRNDHQHGKEVDD